MPDPKPQLRTRIFIVVFFGIALVLALMTIVTSLGTWSENDAAATPATEQAETVVPSAS
jgi:hypothetical protein